MCDFTMPVIPKLPVLQLPGFPSLALIIAIAIAAFDLSMPLPSVSVPKLPVLKLPAIPSLAVLVSIPIPVFDRSMPLPSVRFPKLPVVQLPGFPSLAVQIPKLPPPICPLDAL